MVPVPILLLWIDGKGARFDNLDPFHSHQRAGFRELVGAPYTSR